MGHSEEMIQSDRTGNGKVHVNAQSIPENISRREPMKPE